MGIKLQNTTVSEFKGEFYDQLKAIGQLAYGHGIGEGDKGGKGNIGLVGGKVIKFNTKLGERKNLDVNSVDYANMRECCDALRNKLYEMANDEAVVKNLDMDKVMEKLGMEKDDASLAGGVKVKEDAGLLDRTNTADVLKMLFEAKHKNDIEIQETLDGIWSGHRKTIGSSVAVFKTAVEEYNKQAPQELENEFNKDVRTAVERSLIRDTDGNINESASMEACPQFAHDIVNSKMSTYIGKMNKWYGRVCDFLHGVKPKNVNQKDLKALKEMTDKIDASRKAVENVLKELAEVATVQAKLAPIVRFVKDIETDVDIKQGDGELSEDQKKEKLAALEKDCNGLRNYMKALGEKENMSDDTIGKWLRLLDPEDDAREKHGLTNYDEMARDGFMKGGLADKLYQLGEAKIKQNGMEKTGKSVSGLCSYVKFYFQIDSLNGGHTYVSNAHGYSDSITAHYHSDSGSIPDVVARGADLLKHHVNKMLSQLSTLRFSGGDVHYPDFSLDPNTKKSKFTGEVNNLPENIKPVCKDIKSAVDTFFSVVDSFGKIHNAIKNDAQTIITREKAKESIGKACKLFTNSTDQLLKDVLEAKNIDKIPAEKLQKLYNELLTVRNKVHRESTKEGVNAFRNINYAPNEDEKIEISSSDSFKEHLKNLVLASKPNKISIFYCSGHKNDSGIPHYFSNSQIIEPSPNTDITSALADVTTKPYFAPLHKLALKFGVIDEYGRLLK